jgi:hypothetical protein
VTGYGNFHVNVDRFLIRLFHFLSKNPDVPIILCGSYHRKSIKTYVIVLSTSVRKIKKCDITLNLLPEVSFLGLIFTHTVTAKPDTSRFHMLVNM